MGTTVSKEEKLENLKNYLKELGSVAIAFSSGVDSTFLMKVAHDVLGEKAVALVVGESAMAIREAIIMVGTIVIGAVAATWINITTSLVIVKKAAGTEGITLQSSLDGIYPKILNVVFVLLCWWLMSKKKMSPLATMAIMLAVAFVGVLVGFFNPGLSY